MAIPSTEKPSCRTDQFQLLSQYIPGPGYPLPEALVAQGLQGTGKTATLQHHLASVNIPHAFIHCVEVYQPRLLFQAAVDQIGACLGKAPTSSKLDTVSDFLTELGRVVDDQSAVIVLEGAERLREEGSLLQVFTRLQELSNCNVCCVLETRLDWSRLRPASDIATPLVLAFPQYTRDQLATLVGELLQPEPSHDWGDDFRRSYGSMVVSVFYNVTRSLGELSHIARLNYPTYIKPIVEGQCKHTEASQLWFNIEPELKKCISTVHLREVASRQLTDCLKEADKEKEGELSSATPGSQVVSNVSRITVELPFYSKFLLIAAFLASYNPAKSDKRFFQKHHGKQRKTSSSIRAKERMNSQLTGPKTFPLERLLAIFYNIVDERVNPTASIYSQLSSLVNLHLLTAMGMDMMDQPKYRCNIGLDFVRTIARPLQFDVYKYLYDHC